MNKMKILNMSIIASSALLITGCSFFSPEKNTDNVSDSEVLKRGDNVLNDEFVPNNKITTEDEIFNLEATKMKKLNAYKLEDIIVKENEEGIPRALVNKKLDNVEFKKKKLGSVINLLLSDVDKISLIVGPNVDLNNNINVKMNDLNLYEGLQRIAYSVGYHLYFDKEKNSLIIDSKQSRQYRIPAGILIVKSAENQSKGATIKLQPEEPMKLLEEGLKKAVGSTEKGLFIDKDSGLIIVKDHPMYMEEIDKYVLSFVQDRSRQFMIEAAIVEINHGNVNALGFDITSLQTSVGDLPVFVSSLTGGAGFTGAQITSSFANKDISLNSVLTAINTHSSSNVVDRPRVIVFNHSVGYVNRGSEKSYISSADRITGTNDQSTIVPKSSTYEDGLKLAMRVDASPKKDLITLSLAPSIKTGRLEPVPGEAGDLGYEKLLMETRELMTNANLKDGDIIVLGGIKSYSESKIEEKTPFFYEIPIIGNLFQNDKKDKSKIETLFLVKVKEIKDIEDTFDGAKLDSLDLLKTGE